MADSDKPSDKKNTPLPWVILTGILGIFAVGPPVLNNAAKKDDDKKEASLHAPVKISGKDPLKPIYDFYATHDGSWNPEENLRKQLHNYDVEFLIASVPDPIDTPYGYSFDQVVDAIQRAVEKKDGFVLDRAWLPWELDRKPSAKPDDKTEPFHYRDAYPGVLLFRHAKQSAKKINRPGLCVVFLVGETPMGGLHKRAFTRALRMMAAAGHPETAPVRVIGPYFSGSQTSLQFVVGDWWGGKTPWLMRNPLYHFEVIGGNASALRMKDFFDLDPAADGHPSWQPGKFSMTSTVIPTQLIISATLRYMSRRDGCKSNEPIFRAVSRIPGKTAILTEANTGFGKSMSGIDQDDILLLRFPLHISRVKNEYTQAFRKKDEQSGLKQTDTLVPSGLDESHAPSEGVPSQGGATTTAVTAQVLSNILGTIAREQCRYVGVVASDVRDKLFLIRLIREYCPDVHIFVTDADQLLLHPDYRYHMRGVVVGSTYPLLAQNQSWVNPGTNERILFATVGAQGYYNAMLMHLGLNDRLLEYGPPTFAALERDANGDSKSLRRPPIWISVVSPNGSLVPLQVFTEYEDGGYVRLKPESAEPTRHAALTYPGAMLPLGLGLLAFWSFLVYQALFTRSARMFWEPTSAAADFSLPQLCYRNVLLGSQAVLAVPVLMLIYSHAQGNEFRDAWNVPLVVLAMLLLGGFLLGMIKPLCWPPSRLMRMARWLKPEKLSGGRLELFTWAAMNILVVLVVAGFAAMFLGRFWIYGGPTRRMLFFIRAVDMGSGLSPLTPLFFMSIGYAAWAYFHLKRAQQIDQYAVPPPFPATVGSTSLEGTIVRINDLDAVVQDEVRHESLTLRHARASIFAVVALLALGLALWMQSLPSLEGWSWDGLFFTGFWILFALSATTLVRLYHLWRQTKILLGAIALVPMMRAFARLPAKVSDVFGKYLSTQRPRLEHLQLPLHQMRLLADAAAKDPEAPAEFTDLGRVTDALERRLLEGLDEATDKNVAQRAERDLRGKLSAVAATCLAALAPRWKNLSVEEAYGEGTAKAKDDSLKAPPATEPAWVQIAENVVATQIIIYIAQFFAQLRSLVVATMVCSSILLLAATSYPFHPERLLLVCLMGLSGAGIAAVIWVLLEMNRDEVVSRILKTTPGKLSFDSGIIGSFLTYVVPTIGLLAAQLSGSFRWLLDPILHVMK